MTPTFASPNAAFHAYELSLMTPRGSPPTQLDVSSLWQRAKAMFAALTDTIASAASLFQRLRFTRTERQKLAARLVPVEQFVRILMIMEAAPFLLMSPEGRRLREDTPKIDPPAPPRPTALPVGVAKPAHSTRIETAGWNTIAALLPRIDPRVVEREQREALERRIAGLEALTQDAPAAAAADNCDPENWH